MSANRSRVAQAVDVDTETLRKAIKDASPLLPVLQALAGERDLGVLPLR